MNSGLSILPLWSLWRLSKILSRRRFFTLLEVVVHAGSLSDARTALKLPPVHLDQVVPLPTILADPKCLVVGQVA
jgi:hypothetical protein